MALKSASEAFPDWATLPAWKRAEVLRRAAGLVREKAATIGRLICLEQGKPFPEARGEAGAAAQALEFYAEEARRTYGEVLPTDSPSTKSLVIKQPIGVVSAIAPWNYPVTLLSWKIAPALAAGCTVVAKPASQTPLGASVLVECLVEAGIPRGVVNLVIGPGSTVGNELVENPLSAKISFTGETETGREIMRLAAGSVKRLTLEMGGCCPLIVCPDADVAAAAKQGAYRSFRNMGQICNSINRIYVHRLVAGEFAERVVQAAAALRIGNGLEEPYPDLGPMANREALERTEEHVRDAVSKGAKVLWGGEAPAGGQYARGLFFKPTVLTNVDHSMKVMTEETFGPVAPIMVVDDVAEAVAYANDSPFGLVAYAYTQDLKTATLLGEQLQYGTVGINNVAGGETFYPYGGWKQSGFGLELSHRGIDEYLAVKHIRVALG